MRSCFKDETCHNCFAADVPGTCAETSTSLIALRSMVDFEAPLGIAARVLVVPLWMLGCLSNDDHLGYGGHVGLVAYAGHVSHAGHADHDTSYCCCVS